MFTSSKQQARRMAQAVFDSLPAAAPETVTEDHVRHLPDPVQRFMRYSRVIGAPMTRTVRLKQTGRFRISEKPNATWYPLTAEQYCAVRPPAFIWFGSIRLAPLLSVQGIDVFHGQGRLVIKLLGLIKVVNYHGPQVDQAELVRYLSEIMWFPAACLQPELRWEAIDHLTARATLTCPTGVVSGNFHFDEQGALKLFVAQRERDVAGRPSALTWSGTASQYRSYGDLFLAGRGEASWHLPSGQFPYVRLYVTTIEHNVTSVYAS